MLTAIDGQVAGGGGVDRFRIKIWDKATGSVVYDNQLGASDDEAPTTALGGGSIMIHKSGKNLVLDAAPSGAQLVGASLTEAQLSTAIANAVTYWIGQGLTGPQLQHLREIDVARADLRGSALGLASESTNYVWIDTDAAGYGWRVSGDRAQRGRVDLLSTLTHELGHMLGYDHDVMGESLHVGERYLVTVDNRADHRQTVPKNQWLIDTALLPTAPPLTLNSGSDAAIVLGLDRPAHQTRTDLLDRALADWTPSGGSAVSQCRELSDVAARDSLAKKRSEVLDDDLLEALAVALVE